MKKLLFLMIGFLIFQNAQAFILRDTIKINKTIDFELDGAGTNKLWEAAQWVSLIQLDSGIRNYDTKFKILYSDAGIYVFFTGNDKKVTSSFTKDFENLYTADVFEVFFHPEPKTPIYLEYEVNALNAELVLLVPHLDTKALGWAPWHYDGKRKVTKKVMVHQVNNEMYKWSAELFFPISLFAPLQNTKLDKGVCWNANFYRLDYDAGKMIKWAWSPVIASFHEFDKYGVIQFN
ncbi:MAG: carbohydrate-binding family 9-like protein [Chitinophagia bacterium]|jgi:Carbohydrate-binding family 9